MVPRGRKHPLALRVRPPYWEPDRPPCSFPGCATVPNGYHEGDRCYLHEEVAEPDDAERSRELDLAARRDARERVHAAV